MHVWMRVCVHIVCIHTYIYIYNVGVYVFACDMDCVTVRACNNTCVCGE